MFYQKNHIPSGTYPGTSIQIEKGEGPFAYAFKATADQQLIRQFYHKYGFVIFKDLLNEEEIQQSKDQLWAELQENHSDRISIDDPETWTKLKGFQKAYGFVGDFPILRGNRLWQNRVKKEIVQAFRMTYRASRAEGQFKQKLFCCLDRGSVLFPSKHNSKLQTRSLYHFDLKPFQWVGLYRTFNPHHLYDQTQLTYLLGEGNFQPYRGNTQLAAVLALTDTNQESGGFQCVPGFHNYIKEWCEYHKRKIGIEDDQELLKRFRKVFMKKGSLLIFSRELPHNIYSNKSSQFRFAQYLRMIPYSNMDLSQQQFSQRRKLMQEIVPSWVLNKEGSDQLFGKLN